ncbi:phage major capsid protein [Paenirhodobacter populi]|uniref:phage major capsid protein n=1 Tax=Paenirhodobacter populi TaxID=2306993 RepID=UPI0013E3049E|nr:phage major capsid protein [Sinirhodobacter populi]
MALDMELKAALDDASREIKDNLAKLSKSQKEMAEKIAVMDEKKASGDDLADIKSRLEDGSKEMNQLGELVTDLNKKFMIRQDEGKSIGRLIAEHKDFKSLRDDRKARFEVKDITTGSFGSVELPGGVRRNNRGLITPVNQRLFLRDVIPTASTSAAALEYLQETGYTNNAAAVSEGAQKPQSELVFTPKSAVMAKLAHFFRVSEETLDDVDGMEAYINERGIYGLQLKEEGAVLTGTVATNGIDGLIANSTPYDNTTIPGITPENAIEDVKAAISQVEEADLYASAVIMNHLDWAALTLEKDTAGWYLISNPLTGMQPMLWGLPVVTTKGLPQSKFMVGGFAGNTILWQRKGIEVRRSTEDRDNFVTNKVTILIEERLQLETLRPEGIVYGDLSVE